MYHRASVTAAAIVAAAIAGAGVPARADGADDDFIQALDGQGLQYSSLDQAISVARSDVCDQIAADPGTSINEIVPVVAADTNLSMADSSAFTQSAIAAYCPQYAASVNAPPEPTVDPTPVPGGPINVPIS